jgi:hypothetical protein
MLLQAKNGRKYLPLGLSRIWYFLPSFISASNWNTTTVAKTFPPWDRLFQLKKLGLLLMPCSCRVARICTVNGYICICRAFKIPISQSLWDCLQIPSTNSEAQQISLFHLCKHQVHVAINKAGIQIPYYLLEAPVAHSRIHHEMLDNDESIHQ